MKFTQIIEFRTSRIAEFDNYFDAWITRTQGDRIPHRAVLRQDRDADNRYMLMVEFASTTRAWRTPTAPRRRSSPRSWPGSATVRQRSATSTCCAKRTCKNAKYTVNAEDLEHADPDHLARSIPGPGPFDSFGLGDRGIPDHVGAGSWAGPTARTTAGYEWPNNGAAGPPRGPRSSRRRRPEPLQATDVPVGLRPRLSGKGTPTGRRRC